MRIRWRGLELPSRVICNRETLTDTFGEFHVEPFERGFGHTVGNSLRRILLSSLEGSAITKIKILGVQHEFSSIPGMVDDITDLVLNVKLLVVKNHSESSRTIRIDRDRRGVVTAADILHDESVEIINPDHILCTLTDDVPFHLEMTVENGRGYRTAAEGHTDDLEIGVIPIDASFSPVQRVEYHVENTRVGQRTNYDKLILRIWTTGVLGPEMALVEAAKILRKHLNPFVQYNEPGPGLPAEALSGDGSQHMPIDAELERKLDMSLAELELSVRATNCLESEGITTVRHLVSRSEDQLLNVRNFGETTLKEVRAKLHEIGLDLGMNVPSSQEHSGPFHWPLPLTTSQSFKTMRHQKAGRKFKRSPSHRRMLLRNLATALLEHGKIQTTLAKAKEVQPFTEKLITLAKDGWNLDHFRRSSGGPHQQGCGFQAVPRDRSALQGPVGGLHPHLQAGQGPPGRCRSHGRDRSPGRERDDQGTGQAGRRRFVSRRLMQPTLVDVTRDAAEPVVRERSVLS